MHRLQNKVAVITGGNSGIGKGIAKQFLLEGARVVIFGRNEKTLAETQQEFDNKILTIQGDVTNSADLKNLYEATLKTYGKIDVLVSNSGVGERLHVSDVEEDNFNYLADINYKGAYFTVKYALNYLNQPASVILIASVAGSITLKHHSVYASTKAAVIKLAQNFAHDLAPRAIRVNSISPGYILTPIFDTRLKTDPDYLTKREANIPLQRIGTPEDIGKCAVFLGSEDSSYITGVDVKVDGGYAVAFREPG